MRTLAVVALLGLAACSKKPTALDACHRLEEAGVATNCHEGKPGGLGAAAVARAEFDLVSVPNEHGSVLQFDREEFYANTVDAYDKMASVAGPHRYGNKKALIFTQFNDGASAEVGRKAKGVIDAL